MVEMTMNDSEPTKGTHRTLLGSIGLIVIVALIGISLLFYFRHRVSGNIPKAVQNKLSYALYYPTSLPPGYKYKEGSATADKGLLFYAFVDAKDDQISIGEESAPANPPQLNKLPGFTTLNTNAGTAYLGETLGRPIAIISTNTTLVTVSGTKTTPDDIIRSITRSMVSIPN